ncbi:MAG: Gfo/Idh/MocA family protein [Pseudonocardiaceae bacterium]
MRTLLVGCGNHGGGTLLPAALAAGIRLVGLVDRDIVRARALADQWSIPRAFGSIDEISTADVDTAIIALPVTEQAHHVAWALSNGVHIFVEKPPAVDLTQLRALVSQLDSSGVQCQIGLNFRFADGFQALLSRLDSGRHGDVSYVRVVQIANKPLVSFSSDLSIEASLFHAQGIHAIDLAVLLVPAATNISGQLVRVSRGKLCVVVGENTDAGHRFEVSFGSCAAGLYHQLDVFCDTGDLLSLRNLSELLYLPNGGEQNIHEYPGARVLWRRSPVSVGYKSAGYTAELAAFKDAVGGSTTRDRRLAGLADLLPVYEAFDHLLCSRGLKWTT